MSDKAPKSTYRRWDDRDGKIRWLDWIEFWLVLVLVYLVVARPPLPGIDGGCGGA